MRAEPITGGLWERLLDMGQALLLLVVPLLGAGLVRLVRRRRRAAELRHLEGRAVRYILDAQHHILRLLTREPVPEDELQRQRVLIHEVRDELARADGHEELLAAADAQAEIIQVIKRTQAIAIKKAALRAERDGSPFADGWTDDTGGDSR